MLKNSLTAVLPEFNGDLVDNDILTVYLDLVETSLPKNDYNDLEKAKAYWVAMNYFDATQRANTLDGSANVKSEKIEDISTTYRDGSTENPYKKLFYGSIVKVEDEACEISIGFGLGC